jgi:hypothetical protein
MATTVTFKCYRKRIGQAAGLLHTEITGTLSLNDVSVKTTTTVTSGAATWNTATVTADLQQAIAVNSTDAATAGIDAGWYYKTGASTFTKRHVVSV